MKIVKFIAILATSMLVVLGSVTTATAVGKFTASPVPTISGRAIEGGTLSVNSGTWAPEPTTLTYQWKIGTSLAGSDSTLLVPDDAYGKYVTVSVTGRLEGYKDTVKVSTALRILNPFETYVPPVIASEIWVGDLVTAACGLDDCSAPCIRWDEDGYYDDDGEWIDESVCTKYGKELTLKDSWNPIATTMKYQWLRNGLPIKGATGNYYKAVPADVGASLTLQVIGTAKNYETLKLVSNESTPVQVHQFDSFPAPSLDESMLDPSFGDTLTATYPAEDWAPEPDAYVAQWLRDGAPIKGANKDTYTIGLLDLDHRISFQITGKLEFYQDKSVASNETNPVEKAQMAFPAEAQIAGILSVGQTISLPTAGWSPAKPKFTFQWLRDGDLIQGATKATFKLGNADLGSSISAEIRAVLPGFEDAVQIITAPDPVLASTFSKIPKPSISGSLRIGSILTANAGTYKPAAQEFDYQWYRDGVAILEETASTYELTEEDAGHKISVGVTARYEGLASVTQVSAALSKWTIKTGTLIVTGEELVAMCAADSDGECETEVEEVCEDGYYDDYGDWVDGECTDEETGWYGFRTSEDDSGDFYFDQTFAIELNQKPITWKTSFLGFTKGAYVFSGPFNYSACRAIDEGDSVCDASTTLKPSSKGAVRVSALSKQSSGNEVSFSLYSEVEEAVLWVTKIVITYTYYW